MTALTEVGVSPTKPLSHAAAELALELYILFAVLRTVFHWNFAAVRTYELFWFEICTSIVHCILTGLPSAEVRFLAFEALVV